jgi:hypothetical protein
MEGTMTKFFAGVLSVIALGVMLIAYGLLNPRAAAFSENGQFARPMLANERVLPGNEPYAVYPAYVYVDRNAPAPYGAAPAPYGVATSPYVYAAYPPPAAAVPAVTEARPVRTVVTTQAPPRTTRVVERAPRRDWRKTALVIGGSTATGAGVGAIFGGKKGALIGAAIGGGASTIYESTK